MRAPFSSSMPRLAVVAALVASSAGLANALDEESVADNLQPYIGGWVGMYQVNTDDLELMVAKNRGPTSTTSPRIDHFSALVPAGGISLGVAHGRLHLGANLGYQLRSGGDISKNLQTNLGLHSGFRYEVFPLDFNVEVAMLPNEYPVNLLLGGSGGIGFTRIQNPFKALYTVQGTDTTVYFKGNEFYMNNFALATGFIGARINLARRLNLEGQVGYRLLSTDAVEFGEDPYPAETVSRTFDSTGAVKSEGLRPIEVDLSGVYARVDLRWTFASKAEKERSARLEKRRESLARLDSRFALKD